MALEYEDRTTVLGKFGDVCQGPNLDWRHKCKDEIIENTRMVFADIFWQDLPYQAIVADSSSVNFREASRCEGGTSCSPSTGNVETTLCNFVLPNLQRISIGTQERDYCEWRDRFCEKFPIHRGFSPFVVRGQRLVFRQGDNSPAMRTFAGEVGGELSKVWWDHLYRTYWIGDAANVDQFDGFFKIFEEGITSQGTCDDYPLLPTCINMAEYIIGVTATAAGGTVGPGDVVPDVADNPDPPAGANIITIYPGTQFETTLDITGFDTIDLMTAWFELVTNEWGIDVLEWMLGVGKNQTKCIAEVAACKQACSGGDCRQLLVSDRRDMARADREARYIRERSIRLYPYEDTLIPMRQSPALRQRNTILFMPWTFSTEDGVANSLLWVWRDQRAANEGLFRDVPAWRDYILPGSMPNTELHPGDEFKSVSRAFERRAFDWLWSQNDNCFKWWNNAEALLLPQAPHLWLCIQGVDCSSVITLPCPNPGQMFDIDSCAATTPNLVYDFTFDNPDNDPLEVGDRVMVLSATNATILEGNITTVTTVGPVADIEVTLDAAGPFADCVWDGANLDAGGRLQIFNG